jgi:RHS repeat-associated protein
MRDHKTSQTRSCGQGNPCIPATGGKELLAQDFSWSGLGFSRYYNSIGSLPVDSAMGVHWANTLSHSIVPIGGDAPDAYQVYWIDDKGHYDYLWKDSSTQAFFARNNSGVMLRRNGDGRERWTLRKQDGLDLGFDASGRLIRYGSGEQRIEIERCNSASVASGDCQVEGELFRAVDSKGRRLSFDVRKLPVNYPGSLVGGAVAVRLISVASDQGVLVSYSYDEGGRLVGAEYPGAALVDYRYAEPLAMCRLHNGTLEVGCDSQERSLAFPGLLTSVWDEAGNQLSKYTYDARGRVTQSERAGRAGRVSLEYLDDVRVRVFQPEGGSRLFTFNSSAPSWSGFRRPFEIQEEASDGSVVGRVRNVYDLSYFTKQYSIDARGSATTFRYDNFREIGRVEGLDEWRRQTPYTRSYSSTWDNTLNRMLTRTEPGREIRFAYNSRGQTTARCEVDLAVPAAVAYSQCGSAANAPVGVRQTTYTYCEEPEASAPGSTCPIVGALKSVDGPRVDVADVTTYAYHAATDESGCDQASGACHRRGDLHTVTNALGHVVTHARYDRAGRLTRSIDANGVVTELNYHPRGWLLSRTIKGATAADDATTRFAYAPTGLVSRITQADGSYLDYGYDDAHRLISVTDALGNRIDYTLDPAGNRTAETTFDPQGAVKRQLSRVYNQLGQLREQRDAQLRAYVSEYDANGNSTASTDPLNVRSTQSFDPLNRLQQSLQDVGGLNVSTGYQYDAQDRLTRVIDPKGLHTDYSYSGLGDLTQLSSPDTGVTTYTVDAAGNRLTQTDARGVTVTMQYDALNRLIHQANSQDGEQIVYRYDGLGDSACGGTSYALGRLSQIEDALGTLTYCYDRRGNVIAKHRAPAGASSGTPAWSLQYSYSRADQLLSLRYPNGLELHYGRDAAGRVQSVSYRQGGALQPLISAIDYAPFGPALRLQYANGSEWTRSLDADYRIQRIAAPGLEVDFGLDAVGNIVALDQGSQQHTIDYDALYRLQALRAGTSDIEGFSYDATGNRLSYSQPAVTQSYSYPSNSHRLDAINGASRSYTAAGNTSVINGLSLDYSGFNRLSRVANNGLDLQRAHYNGRGEREHRWTASAPRYFGYDEGGRLLFEGDSATGALRQLFVWLDDQPVALLPQAGAYAGEVLHVHADHLGSPRVVTRPAAGNATVWRWALEGSAFGQHPAEADVDGDGVALEFNLRYPGQYFDSATGWHYNYFRDYEPGTGRYVQSDPIGLEGGINTFGFVHGNPMVLIDPSGNNALLRILAICLRFPSACLPPPPPRPPRPYVDQSCPPGSGLPCWEPNPAPAEPLPLPMPFAPTSTGELCPEDEEFCREQRRACAEQCAAAQSDPDRSHVYGGSISQCIRNCLPERCGGEPTWKGLK